MGRIVFLASFLGLLFLPLFQMATGLFPMPLLAENRRLAAPPAPGTPLPELPRAWEHWFGDHFGLRPILVRAKAQIDLSVFGQSDRVLIGRGGQLFYRSTVNVEAPAAERFLLEHGEAARRGAAALAAALERRGIGLVVTVNMMSDRFLPELLPADAVPRPPAPAVDRLVTALAATPGVLLVDSTPLLRAAMRERPVFHRTDFHWNDPAAFPVAKAIVDAIAAREGRPSPWRHALEVERRSFAGGISAFMPVFAPPSEEALFSRPNWTWPAGLEQGTDQGPFEHVIGFAPDPALLPPVVLVGDSFLDGMLRNGLAAHFQSAARIRWREGLRLEEVLDALPPDTGWVVLQFIEVQLPALRALAAMGEDATVLGAAR